MSSIVCQVSCTFLPSPHRFQDGTPYSLALPLLNQPHGNPSYPLHSRLHVPTSSFFCVPSSQVSPSFLPVDRKEPNPASGEIVIDFHVLFRCLYPVVKREPRSSGRPYSCWLNMTDVWKSLSDAAKTGLCVCVCVCAGVYLSVFNVVCAICSTVRVCPKVHRAILWAVPFAVRFVCFMFPKVNLHYLHCTGSLSVCVCVSVSVFLFVREYNIGGRFLCVWQGGESEVLGAKKCWKYGCIELDSGSFTGRAAQFVEQGLENHEQQKNDPFMLNTALTFRRRAVY